MWTSNNPHIYKHTRITGTSHKILSDKNNVRLIAFTLNAYYSVSFLGQMVHLKINTENQLCKMKSCMWDEMTHSVQNSSLVHVSERWPGLKWHSVHFRDEEDISRFRCNHCSNDLSSILFDVLWFERVDVSTVIPCSASRDHWPMKYIYLHTSFVYI